MILALFAALSLGLPLSRPLASNARAPTKIKLATLVPENSIWGRAFREMGEDWKRSTEGRIDLHIYPGGVAGDEPDIVRKMRIGQLHAASLTISGFGEIDPAMRFFEIPLSFESDEEILHVLDGMTPVLSERLLAKGFVLIHWGHAGWIRLFSVRPIVKLDDLRQQKQFLWAGDNRMVQWWKDNGFQPVPLAATEIATGLQTGLIEVVPATPLAALSLQWFRSTPHMLDHPVLPFQGGTVIAKAMWDKISEADRKVILEAGARCQEFLRREVPLREREAIEEMKNRGLSVTSLDPKIGIQPWRDASKSFAAKARGLSVPEDFFDQALRLRDEFRARKESGGKFSD
jgi:TRAP-type C4-dicarboxylate transport system substrate-binding protein